MRASFCEAQNAASEMTIYRQTSANGETDFASRSAHLNHLRADGGTIDNPCRVFSSPPSRSTCISIDRFQRNETPTAKARHFTTGRSYPSDAHGSLHIKP